jgi:GT2 family glycosyltransferase
MLSIVVVNWNAGPALDACLASVAADGLDGREVIVVDNASTDGTRTMLAAEFPGIRTILNDENKRWAGGNNQGAAAAVGEYLLFLNSDTEAVADAPRAFLRFLVEHPGASIAGCRLLNTDGTLQRSARSFPGMLNLFFEAFFLDQAFPRSRIFGRYKMTFFDHDEVREVDWVSGAAIAVRKDAFAAVGPFDEDFHFYGEETDYCFRAKALGHRTMFFPDAVIVHHGGGSPLPRQDYFENLYLGLRRFLVKHHHGSRLAAMITLQWTGTAVRVPVYFLRGLLTVDRDLFRKSLYYLKLLL